MSDATPKGVSQKPAFGAVPAKPKIDESTVVFDNDYEGADDIQATADDVDSTSTTADDIKGEARNPRDDLIDGMHAKVEANRRQDLIDAGLPAPEDDDDEPEVKAKVKAKPKDNDPLAAFMVIKDDKPMFRTVINGKEQLIPMDRARDQLQKAEAAEVRMARAAETERGLKARENQLLANEQALTSRLQALSKPPSAATADEGRELSDEEILRESQDLVATLFTGTREEATARMAKTLAKNRRGTNAPVVDPVAIGRDAVQVAKHELSREANEKAIAATKKDVSTGYQQFSADYPEILADDRLFRYADGMTDTIAEDNPDWAPSKVMLEAGRATREWVESLKAPSTSKTQNSRQSRKDGLVPIPRATSARREPGEVSDEDAPQSPRLMLAEIRKARGQA